MAMTDRGGLGFPGLIPAFVLLLAISLNTWKTELTIMLISKLKSWAEY